MYTPYVNTKLKIALHFILFDPWLVILNTSPTSDLVSLIWASFKPCFFLIFQNYLITYRHTLKTCLPQCLCFQEKVLITHALFCLRSWHVWSAKLEQETFLLVFMDIRVFDSLAFWATPRFCNFKQYKSLHTLFLWINPSSFNYCWL